MMPAYERLECNMIDVIAEQQLKIGYREESVALYYPLESLQHFLRVQTGSDGMRKVLTEFKNRVLPRLGDVRISRKGDRYCLRIPPEGNAYVHGLAEAGEIRGLDFLRDFLKVVSGHGAGLAELAAVFRKYSEAVRIERLTGEEFDYLFYFEDGEPDDYRYCVSLEGSHMIYHRFTEEDYRELGFAAGTPVI